MLTLQEDRAIETCKFLCTNALIMSVAAKLGRETGEMDDTMYRMIDNIGEASWNVASAIYTCTGNVRTYHAHEKDECRFIRCRVEIWRPGAEPIAGHADKYPEQLTGDGLLNEMRIFEQNALVCLSDLDNQGLPPSCRSGIMTVLRMIRTARNAWCVYTKTKDVPVSVIDGLKLGGCI